jgi:hypothetical protein
MVRGSSIRATLLSALAGLAAAIVGAAGGLYVRYGLHWGEQPLPTGYCYRDNIIVLLALVPFCLLAAAVGGATSGAMRSLLLIVIALLGFVLATFVQTYTDSMSCSLLW